MGSIGVVLSDLNNLNCFACRRLAFDCVDIRIGVLNCVWERVLLKSYLDVVLNLRFMGEGKLANRAVEGAYSESTYVFQSRISSGFLC